MARISFSSYYRNIQERFLKRIRERVERCTNESEVEIEESLWKNELENEFVPEIKIFEEIEYDMLNDKFGNTKIIVPTISDMKLQNLISRLLPNSYQMSWLYDTVDFSAQDPSRYGDENQCLIWEIETSQLEREIKYIKEQVPKFINNWNVSVRSGNKKFTNYLNSTIPPIFHRKRNKLRIVNQAI